MKRIGFVIILLLGFLKVQAECATGFPPGTPVIDYITVDLAGNVTICWQAVSDPDLDHYDIGMIDPVTGAFQPLGSVPAGTLCFTLPSANPLNTSSTGSMELFVAAVDNCIPVANSSPSGANLTNTIFLDSSFDPCTSSVSLQWNAYDDFSSPSVNYEVYLSLNGSLPFLAGTTFSTSYNYPGISQGNTYDFFVTGIENSGSGPFSSSSNLTSPNTANALIVPAFNYLYNVTVVDSQQIDLQFYVDTAADVSSYIVQRATNKNGPFTRIDTVNAFQGMDTLISVSDTEVNTDSVSYFYQIEIINSCLVPSDTSNLGSTIWLNVVSSPVEAVNTLTITEYKGWQGGVLRYDIYRAVAGVWELAPIKSTFAFNDTTTYVDDITSVYNGNGEYSYKVIAVEKTTVPRIGLLPEAQTTSNEASALHEPLLYIPNAFSPNGLYNTGFKPVLTFSNPASYSLQIFNRWGQRVFQTSDLTAEWNGRFDNSGDINPAGVYVYIVAFESAEGTEFSKRGTVTIVD